MSTKTPGRMRRFLKRVLIYSESPLSLLTGTMILLKKVGSPTKVQSDEFAAFKNLTQEMRWQKLKKNTWTNEQLLKDRARNCLLAYIFFGCSLMILIGTGLAVEYMNLIQIAGAVAYAGAALIVAARKSMWCYALDTRRVVLFNEWLCMPNIWVPAPSAKGGF